MRDSSGLDAPRQINGVDLRASGSIVMEDTSGAAAVGSHFEQDLRLEIVDQMGEDVSLQWGNAAIRPFAVVEYDVLVVSKHPGQIPPVNLGHIGRIGGAQGLADNLARRCG